MSVALRDSQKVCPLIRKARKRRYQPYATEEAGGGTKEADFTRVFGILTANPVCLISWECAEVSPLRWFLDAENEKVPGTRALKLLAAGVVDDSCGLSGFGL